MGILERRKRKDKEGRRQLINKQWCPLEIIGPQIWSESIQLLSLISIPGVEKIRAAPTVNK